MRHTDRPRLPDWIKDAYDTLECEFASGTRDITHTEAQKILLSEEGHIEEDADAVYAIDRLLDRGWLYEVSGQLRKTE
jgi:hypothetical protein